MKPLNLLVGLNLALLLAGCPGDDGTEEGGETGPTTDNGSTSTTTMTPMTTEDGETTDGTTMEPADTTTTGDPDSTTTTEPTTTDATTDDTTTGEPALSFEADVYPIIMANCSCHVEGSSGMLPMPDAATAYDNLVDVPSANLVNLLDRIEPGDPDASFLWHKVNGTQGIGEGEQMPLGGEPLGAPDLETIEAWILGGAMP